MLQVPNICSKTFRNRSHDGTLPACRVFRGILLVAVGISVTRYPPHRSPRAALPHKMCSNTFNAVCGLQNYVAPTGQLFCRDHMPLGGRHISKSLILVGPPPVQKGG